MAPSTPDSRRGPFGGRTLPIGRIFGIQVGIDPSWFIIFVVITLMLHRNYALQNESWSEAMAWGAGFAIALLYFVSILAHELGHSVMAQLLGLPVISITLFLFGGLARLSGEPARPRDEFLIAICGPAVSLLLAGVFFLVWAGASEGSVVRELSLSLCQLNFMLGVFNMIPGFPLDGGHVFRSMLWAMFDDLGKATRWSGNVGALFARILIGAGLMSAIFVGGSWILSGLFLAFVGWFLLRAARASVWQSTVKEHLDAVRVGTAMESMDHRVDKWTTVEDAAEGPFANEGQSFVFVEDEGELTGVVTLRDVIGVAAEKRAFQLVTEVMTSIRECATIGPRETLFTALESMESASCDRLLVMHEGNLIGALSRDQVSHVLRNRMKLKR